LLGDFAACFDAADEVVLLPIYAAREADPGDISSASLAAAIQARADAPACRLAGDFAEAAAVIRSGASSGDMVLTLGAGNIEALSAMIRE
jgi:UDP-N-acetylmuramate--alanine ligase